jgi:hypothetical protein
MRRHTLDDSNHGKSRDEKNHGAKSRDVVQGQPGSAGSRKSQSATDRSVKDAKRPADERPSPRRDVTRSLKSSSLDARDAQAERQESGGDLLTVVEDFRQLLAGSPIPRTAAEMDDVEEGDRHMLGLPAIAITVTEQQQPASSSSRPKDAKNSSRRK